MGLLKLGFLCGVLGSNVMESSNTDSSLTILVSGTSHEVEFLFKPEALGWRSELDLLSLQNPGLCKGFWSEWMELSHIDVSLTILVLAASDEVDCLFASGCFEIKNVLFL